MRSEDEAIWQADMLDRYPMDSNAMVAWLDPERLELLLTYVEETTLSDELARFVRTVAERHPKYLRVKELFETVEAYRRIGQDVYEHWRDGHVQAIYDMCAGHGLLGLLLGYRFRKLSVLCVDAERRPAFDHYLAIAADLGIDTSNVTYVEADVAAVDIRPGAYVICIHACNELTKTIVERAVAAGARFAAMPCCIRDGIYFRRIKHVDEDVMRYAVAAGYIAGRYAAEKVTAIDERITNRNLIILGGGAG
jgi:hypothetical protein